MKMGIPVIITLAFPILPELYQWLVKCTGCVSGPWCSRWYTSRPSKSEFCQAKL